MSDFSIVLERLLIELDKILILFQKFLEKGDVNLVEEAASLMVVKGGEFQSALGEYSHRILTAMLIEAGLRIKERTNVIRERGLRREDFEYIKDIYSVFKQIADKIRTGEYESSYWRMVEKRSNY